MHVCTVTLNKNSLEKFTKLEKLKKVRCRSTGNKKVWAKYGKASLLIQETVSYRTELMTPTVHSSRKINC